MHAEPYLEPGATGGFIFWRRLSLVLLSAVFGACFCAVYFLTTVGHVNPHDQQPNRRSTMTNERTLPPWKPGMLDIHHLHVGPSESSFLIYPDGTTMLIDAGDIDLPRTLPRLWRNGRSRLKIRPPYPNSSKSTAEWILDYMHHFWPRPDEDRKTLDYFLLTQFASDHMGDPGPDCRSSTNGKYRLSGITEIASQISIAKIVDRAYPKYDFPIDLAKWPSKPFQNYRNFIAETCGDRNVSQVEKFNVGSNSQFIEMRNQSSEFQIRNLKSNLDVVNVDGDVVTIEGELFTDPERIKWNENELSCAVVVEYGAFRYYEGGDQEARRDKFGEMDTITPTAMAAGPVDVATANDHGQGVNQAFSDVLDPEIIILQGIFSDKLLKPAMSFMTRMKSDGRKRALLMTDIYEESLKAIGEDRKAFASTEGHIVVRVHAPGPDQYYEVFILDGGKRVKDVLGPFKPRFSSGP